MSVVKLDGPRLAPAQGPAKQLVVFLHGYGADGQDLVEIGRQWQGLLPNAAFVAPNAPTRVPGSPFGFQWFGLGDYDPDLRRRDPAAAEERYAGMLDKAAEPAAVIDAFLDAELAALNLTDANLALVGFSQGTMMSLHVGLRRAKPCAAIVGFSGMLLGAPKLPTQIRSRPPVLLAHGQADPMVPADLLFPAMWALAASGVTVQAMLTPNLGHGIDPGGLQRAGFFLYENFP